MSIATLVAAAFAVQANTAVTQEITAGDPLVLFKDTCLSDQVQLAKELFAPVEYKSLPAPAKEALGFSLMMETDPKVGAKSLALAENEVPNRFFSMRKSNKVFLMVPASANANGPVTPQCGVIWRGHHYAEALKVAKAIRPLPQGGAKVPERSALPGFGFEVIHAQGAIIGVAEDGDWTVLRIAADTSE